MKTLLVEDDPTFRAFLETVLRARGHEVSVFHDAEAAWEAYRRRPYPLVLLDWVLPGIEGVELCRRMRRLPHGDRSLILIVTARDEPDDLKAVLEAGADDYLTKPVDPELLNIRISIAEARARNLLERKRVEAKLEQTLEELEKSHDDMLSILNQLRIGTAITDKRGRITFLSETAQDMLGRSGEDALGKCWDELFPGQEEGKVQLKAILQQPQELRPKVLICTQTRTDQPHWLEVEVRDDPSSPVRKIFCLYDVSTVHHLRHQLEEKAQFHDLVGKSKPMRRVYQYIRDLAEVDSTVVIEGETGTGKELVARAIHFSSHRKSKPFIIVNSAGLTTSLVASQLFGHKRGSFTGAVEDHKGLFEAAHSGTLFLDEVGDIPMSVQASFLRVLESKEITRMGESKPRGIDVRIIAATNHDLSLQVERGLFREDLFYRIRVARIQLPPLRERCEDIPLLIKWFLQQCRAATGKPVTTVSDEASRALLAHTWPGNVRELGNAIEFAVIRCHGESLQADDLPVEIIGAGSSPALPNAGEQDEKQRILSALEQARGNRSAAARLLGISRATLYRRLADSDLDLDFLRHKDPSAQGASLEVSHPGTGKHL